MSSEKTADTEDASRSVRSGGVFKPGGLRFNLPGVVIALLLLVCLWTGLYLWGSQLALMPQPMSPVLLDDEGNLLGTRIAADEQWRLPWWGQRVPEKYKIALLEFEDHRFEWHPGIDFMALGRAFYSNLWHRKVVSGASTLTMQLMRMRAGNSPRTIPRKLLEMLQAVAIEQALSKEEILQLYASLAPMGGNTVGLQAASWRYFGRSAEHLSWGESALLAVLPNNPAMMHPGRNRKALKAKRNFLLLGLLEKDILDSLEYQLAIAEPLPAGVYDMPDHAQHYLQQRIERNERNESNEINERFPGTASKPGENVFQSALDAKLQKRLQQELNRWQLQLEQMEINSVGAVIYDNEKQEFVAWCGNATNRLDQPERWVDMVSAPRSSGSILKPFLYGRMFESGELYPQTLVKDIPLSFKGFTPENYDRTYRGAVPAHQALALSLNVPAVELLRKHGVDRFYSWMQQNGLSTLFRSADQYGLSLILGGAEVRLDEIVPLYSAMAMSLIPTRQNSSDATNKTLDSSAESKHAKTKGPDGAKRNAELIQPAAVWQVLEAMSDVRRPGLDSWWKNFSSSRKLSWKTGTSIGHRDAWAVGVTPRYTIGVLAGNADGFGRPEITGTTAAAPLLFRMLDFLPKDESFPEPIELFQEAVICPLSGHPAGRDCSIKDTILVPLSHVKLSVCPYHQKIHLDQSEEFRVDAACYNVSQMRHESRFVLPPAMAWYYQKSHPEYQGLPQWHSNCQNARTAPNALSFIYPDKNNLSIWLPLDDEVQRNPVVFRVTHTNPSEVLYWHLDNTFLGKTHTFHQFPVRGEPGWHTLSVVDQQGNAVQRRFRFIHKK